MIENPQVGDRVRITANVGGRHGDVGNTGTVLEVSGRFGGMRVKMDGAISGGAYELGVYDVPTRSAERITPDAPAAPLTFEVGCRVELTRPFNGAPAGTTGTMVRTCCGGIDAWFTVDGQSGEHRVEFSHLRVLPPEPASPIPADATLADLQAQKQRAERELQEFKDLVHRRVCEISDERNWCTDADAWLEGLGLPPREEPEPDYEELGVPQYQYAIARLSNGQLVVRKDTDDEPWYVIEGSGYSGYLSDADVYNAGFTALFDGCDY